MWYFTWILGILFAATFGIVNALWLEATGILEEEDAAERDDAAEK